MFVPRRRQNGSSNEFCTRCCLKIPLLIFKLTTRMWPCAFQELKDDAHLSSRRRRKLNFLSLAYCARIKLSTCVTRDRGPLSLSAGSTRARRRWIKKTSLILPKYAIQVGPRRVKCSPAEDNRQEELFANFPQSNPIFAGLITLISLLRHGAVI